MNIYTAFSYNDNYTLGEVLQMVKDKMQPLTVEQRQARTQSLLLEIAQEYDWKLYNKNDNWVFYSTDIQPKEFEHLVS